MEVFSLLKFWRTNTRATDFDSSIDEEESFFDLVFTNPAEENDYSYVDSPINNGFGVYGDDLNSSFRFSSPGDEVYLSNLNNTKNIFTFDSLETKVPQSPLRSGIEEVKIGALLTRDNSLRCKLLTEKLMEGEQTPSKRFSKDVVNKYLNKMKPKVSKRSEKSRFSERDNTPSSSPASSVFSPRKEEKRGGVGGGAVFREVRKRLGKSRSASAILQTPKSNDSAIEQQDGIQGAILHCKRSYNSPSIGCVLSRSGSAPTNNQQRISGDDEEDDMSTI